LRKWKRERGKMSWKIVSEMMLILLLISMLAIGFNIQPTEAGTITVPEDYPTIQEAINHANEGDTIYVLSGTYYENVVVNKTVSLIGEDKTTTIIDGMGIGTVLNLTVNNVKVVNFTIRNGSTAYPHSGIQAYNSSGIEISDNIISGSYHGILLHLSSNNSLSNNTITNSGLGIKLRSSSYNTIFDNTVTDSDEGITLVGAVSNKIANNNITQNDYGIIISNSFNDSVSGNNILNNTFINIDLWWSWNITVFDNLIANSKYGISQMKGGDHTIHSNDIINNTYFGLYIEQPYYSLRVFHNNFINNTDQASIVFSNATWDDGYPSGGNYWSDYDGIDVLKGIYQNEIGSDGIGDTPYVIDTGNRDNYPLMKPYPWGSHDIGVTYIGRAYFEVEFLLIPILPLRTVVGIGLKLHFNVFVMNYGSNPEIFNVTVYANTTVIDAFTDINLAGRSSLILNFTWDTEGFAKGNYTIKAYASPVPDETDTADNTCLHSIFVATDGDVNGNGVIDIFDIVIIAASFGSSPPPYPNADLNDDGLIDVFDIVITAASFGVCI